ncbi:ABC transporter substrate-binding protein [Photobacterium sp. ZSDE20]|uniref:ABC transporter substrate-binding protein n=1 Tax=Photobacterium pectinilyticum TaxID=2906793 RepID=A0ABT1MVE3_9GAMM|nr:ABC transporter substrate-binding protein [Photobacterium sp. ZSDE20]MCQ1056480.1 ABC transporter substrate-binding protein [Photobacterium sp. ZSDE20]MDD1820615.1 ABC transporter substrate-binding protein [Photobacterium sp. ZSDE20]
MNKTLIGLALASISVSSVSANDSTIPNLKILSESTTAWTHNFNPWLGGLSSAEFAYEPLYVFNLLDDTKEYPWLATGYELSEDLKVLTVTLRENVTWSDGKPFTADDVVFSFEYTHNNPGIDLTGLGSSVESIEKVNDYEVKIYLSKQNAFSQYDILTTKIIPQHIWSEIENPSQEVVRNPVGTGPFTEIERFTPQVYIQCKNENYWNPDLALNCLEFPQFSSSDAALEMMAKGESDWNGIFVPDIERLFVKAAEGNKYWFPSGDGVRITLNFQTKNEGARKAFSDVNFRKAFNLSMDREAMRDLGAYGYVELGNSASNLPGSLHSWRNKEADKTWAKYTQYNLAEAKKYLLDAGYKDVTGDGYVENPDGSELKLLMQVPSGWSAMVNNAMIAIDGLRDAGINANLITPEVQAYSQNWRGGNFDATFGGGSIASSGWKFYDYTMHSRYAKSGQWWSSTMTNYQNPELDGWIQQLSVTFDHDEQREIATKIERHFADNAIQIPLYYNAIWYSYNDSRFTGFFNADNPVAHPAPFESNKLLHVMHIKPRT